MGFKKKKIFGVGINDADYTVCPKTYLGYIDGKKSYTSDPRCPYYVSWVSMLRRCYSESVKKTRKTYEGCITCDEWHLFSNFKSWMEQQDWRGKELDKDILGSGKLYSPDSCCFVEPCVNNFIASFSRPARKGGLPMGVRYDTRIKYKSFTVTVQIFNKKEYMGGHATRDEAIITWKSAKIGHCNLLISGGNVQPEIVDKFKNKVEELLSNV